MENSSFLIIIAFLIILFIGFLTVRYFLYPLIFKPKIKTSEIIEFLNKKECALIEYKSLGNKDRPRKIFNRNRNFPLNKLISAKSEYKIIGCSLKDNQHKIYWTELIISLPPFGKRQLNFIEEKDPKELDQSEKTHHQEIIKVTNKCPACDQKISTNDAKCGSCGLHLIA